MVNFSIYARESSDDSRKAPPIQEQIAAGKAWGEERGYNLVQVYADDGYSGGDWTRPEWNQALPIQDVTPGLRRLAGRLLMVGYVASAFAVSAAVAGLLLDYDVFLILWGLGFGIAMTAAVASAHIDLTLTKH
jgi:hypothetical protein